MALQTSGQITLKDIWEEVNRATYSSGQISLSALKTAAAEPTFNSLSDWYSYSQTLDTLNISYNGYQVGSYIFSWSYDIRGNEVNGRYGWQLQRKSTSQSTVFWTTTSGGTQGLSDKSIALTITTPGIYRVRAQARADNYNFSTYGLSIEFTV